MMGSPGNKMEWLCAKRKAMESPRLHWDSWWQELADFVSPRKAEITDRMHYPADDRETILYDSTAVQANLILAQGQMSLVSPMEEQWFQLDSPREIRHIPEVRRWYSECTEIMKLELANSNFYSQVMEMYLDRGAFGTAMMSLQESYDPRSCLNFKSHNIGTYSIEESPDGYVDIVFSQKKLSAHQIEREYGLEDVHSKVREAAQNPKKMHDPVWTVYMAVFPRGTEPGETKSDGVFAWDKQFSSYHWMEDPGKTMLREGGFNENPFFCTRYLRWGDDPYGWCPGWAALPEARQLNFLERMLDSLVEVQVFPRLLIPGNMVDEVDLQPGGVTVFNQFQQAAKPEEWASQGRYDVGLDRAQRKEKKIEEAYHVDLFKMFSQMEARGQMTAREVAERSAEKIIQFSPTFARLTTEIFTPLLKRTFHILNERSKFPQPPLSAVQGDQQGLFIPQPEVIYVSKLALAIKTMQNTSFMSLLEALTPMAQFDPSVFRFLDSKRVTQGLARNFGVPQEWLATEEEVAESEAAMAQQAQDEQMMQAAEGAGKLPPEMLDKLAPMLAQGQ